MTQETMKGYVFIAQNEVGWRDVPRPRPGFGDAVIRPVCISPCTTDVHLVESNAMPYLINKPMGHEVVGIVDEVGPGVTEFKPGDRVAVASAHPIWNSMEAQEGRAKIADSNHYYNTDPEDTRGGCFAEYFNVENADMNLAHIPDSVSFEQAVILTDMGATAFPCIEALDIHFGDTVVIYGIGPTGLMGICAAKMKGAARIFAIGSRKACIDVALEYGATDIIDYHDGDVAQQILAKTGGKFVDSVGIFSGTMEAIGTSLMMVKPGGTVATVGAFFNDHMITFPSILMGYGTLDKTIKSVKATGGRNYMERLMALIEYGGFRPEKVISHRFEGFDKIADAFTLMGQKTPDLIKPVVNIKY